ncbi:MAG TPA: helix-turn-helix domain-containing protein [Sphingobium sp.]|uniref:TetR/AcrR family transcriptional regulator n=1 Tax=Sphingobium sp. TaxID=1912891 RepID=UPI002ED46424
MEKSSASNGRDSDDRHPPLEMPNISSAEYARQSAPAIRARDARARRTMQLLHEAFLSLVETTTVDRITVDDIVERAGIGRSTFYRHFETKEALIDEIATTEIEHLVDLAFPLMNAADTRSACRALAGYVDEHRRLWNVLLTGGASAIMRETFIRLASARAATSLDGFAPVLPVELGVVAGVGATIEILAWWLRQPDPVSVEQAAEYLDRLTVRPALDGPRPA